MTDALDAEETVVVATYSTRRDAEMAKDRLAEAEIQSFITADDAGGMHPQMQAPHGVKLLVLQRAAERAHEVLADAALLPESLDPVAPPDADESGDAPTFSMGGVAGTLGAVALLLILLWFLSHVP